MTRPQHTHDDSLEQKPAPHNHGGHSWLMIACCIPMLIIAVALVATDVVSSGFLIIAIACTTMMAVMMRAMHGNDD
jgi:hypothetical protein